MLSEKHDITRHAMISTGKHLRTHIILQILQNADCECQLTFFADARTAENSLLGCVTFAPRMTPQYLCGTSAGE